MCLAIPGKVISLEGQGPEATGRVDFGGIRKEIHFAYVPDVRVGDYVMVHAGFAISIVDEKEAREVFEYLKIVGEAGEIAPGEGPADAVS